MLNTTRSAFTMLAAANVFFTSADVVFGFERQMIPDIQRFSHAILFLAARKVFDEMAKR